MSAMSAVPAKPTIPAILLFFILVLVPVNTVSADFFNFAFTGGLNYFAADNGPDSDPAPIIPYGGFSLSLQLHRFFRIELTEDIYFSNYEYNPYRNYPMTTSLDNRSAFVLGFVTGIMATGVFPLGDFTFRVFGGPAADFRLVLLAIGLNHPNDLGSDNIRTSAPMQTQAIQNYFWSDGRWFMPVAGLGFDFPVNDNYLIGLDIRTWFPIYRLWTNEDIPAIDGWRFSVGLRITPRFNN